MLVSVIIPTYNRLDFLREAVESVRAQSYGSWELIVVDDGSTDGTPEARCWDGVRYIRTGHSGRPGLVRNLGARAAQGRLLAFLDSDDLWKPQKLARQAGFLQENPGFSLCHTREIWLRFGKVISQSGQRHLRSGDIFEDALKKCIIGPSTVLLTRKLFFEHEGFDPDLEIAEDYEFWLRICNAQTVGYIEEPLVIKRGGHEDQLSSKYDHIEMFRLEALRKNINRGIFQGRNAFLACKEAARKSRIWALGCRKRGREGEARRYLLTAADYEERAKKYRWSADE